MREHSLTELGPGVSRFMLNIRAAVWVASLAFAGLLSAAAVSLSGCAVPDSEVAACLSQGTYMDMRTRRCAVLPKPPPPTAAQIEQSQRINADLVLLQRCDPRIRARYDDIISQLDMETVNYWRYSHQDETAQEFSAYADHERLRMQLHDERLQACRSAAAHTTGK